MTGCYGYMLTLINFSVCVLTYIRRYATVYPCQYNLLDAYIILLAVYL